MKPTRLVLALLAASAAVASAAVGCSGADVVIPGGDGPDGSSDGSSDAASDGGDAAPSVDSATQDGSPQADGGEREGGKACNVVTPNDCGPGSYCDSPTCGVGTCKPTPGAEVAAPSPVCGCDDVTYWNESIAHAHGVSVTKNAACAPAKMCGGIANIKCPADTFCNYEGKDISTCASSDEAGNCWGVPSTCPAGGGTAKFRACGAATCDGRCQQIKAESTFYSDLTCQ
jgi:hypothetical protein